MKNRIIILTAVVLCTFIATPVLLLAQDDHEHDHKKMRGEHVTAESEHEVWLTKIGKMRIEHRQALSALARLESEILQHEAEIEKMVEHIRSHELKLRKHDVAIHKHETHGEGDQHDHLEAAHNKLMTNHKDLKKTIKAEETHHDDLIQGIMKLVDVHLSKFHSHEESSHKHSHSEKHHGHGHGKSKTK